MPKEFFKNLLKIKEGNIFFLTIIFLIALVLRFWQLGSVPMSLNWDEAAWGYNAYSIGVDRKDEFGVTFPYKYIESFGDFKPPVYAYLATLPVKILGLNEFSTRFPSALFGCLTVLITYLLVKEIFPKNPQKEKLALFSALFLSISPWHIMLSRAAFEANVSTFFIVFGIFLFLRAVNKNMWYLLFSAISFAVSFYVFNTARIFVPMIVVFMGIVFSKDLLRAKKQSILSILLGFVLLMPLIPFLLSPQAKLRYQEVNIFSNSEIVKISNQSIANDRNAIWSKVINNRRILYGKEFAKHYLDNLNPSFLFIKGDGNPKFSSQDIGQLFLWDLPFLIIGVFILFRKKDGHFWVIPIWLLLGIIPAATARETPHALRIETVLPTFQILTALGFVFVLNNLKTRFRPKITLGISFCLVLLLFLNAFYFIHSYYSHYGRESAADWNYAYKDAYKYLKEVENRYDNIYFTNALGRPYIYYLFNNKISPEYYRNNSEIKRDVFGFVHVDKIGKYNFNNVSDSKNSIHVERWDKIPENVTVLREFNLPDGGPMLSAYVEN